MGRASDGPRTVPRRRLGNSQPGGARKTMSVSLFRFS